MQSQNAKLGILLMCIGVIMLAFAPDNGMAQWELQKDPGRITGQISPLEDEIEKTAEALEMDQDYSDLADELVDLSVKPVNLNSAREDELDAIPFLTPQQRADLLNYLTTYGQVFSLYELQSIKGFDSVLIQNIRPFISVSPVSHVPAPTPANLVRFGHHNLLLRYQQTFPESAAYLGSDSVRKADPDACYPGNPQRYYFRYNYTWFDRIQIGIAGEKDPGEQFFRGAQSKGMDFYAGYLCLANLGILKNLTLGNFRVSYGQGLTIGSGLSLGSIPGFSTGLATAKGIMPGLGMNEESYLRGLAATIKIKPVVISGFVSFHPRDATVIRPDSNSSKTGEISSFTETGYHRTPLELSKRNALTELVCGGNINFSLVPNQQFGCKIGVTGLFCKYSAAVLPKFYPYNLFGFRGNQNLNTGIDFQIRFHGIYLYGEMSRSLNHGLAWLYGISLSPDPRVYLVVICRNYQVSCQNLFSNAFGQNSLNANEQGIYTAINASIHPKVNFSGYIDLFTFPWLKYRVDSPTLGREFGVMMGWQASGNVKMLLRFYQKNSRSNAAAEPHQVIHHSCEYLARSYRFGLDWLPVNGLLLKTQIDVKEAGESTVIRPVGYVAFQEVQVKAFKWPEAITLRFALFDVPAYASRIYVYEPEVLYGYNVPAYEGQGMRTCLVVKFGFSRHVDLWLRGGLIYYTDRSEVGTGPDLTKGNIRCELTGQLMVRL